MNKHKNIFIIGPGGVGKTTVGKILVKSFGYKFIDLDEVFCREVGTPGDIIDRYGYEKYCEENSKLFGELLTKNMYHTVFTLSSGFLVHENQNALIEKHKQALKDNGITVLLMPSESIQKSEKIIIQRQLERGLGLNKTREKEKFRSRFPKYLSLGDIKIFSNEGPESIADKIKKELSGFTGQIG